MLLFLGSTLEETRTKKHDPTEPDFVAVLADESPDAAIITMAEGTVLYWNKGAESTFEYTPSETVGRAACESIVPGDRVDDEVRVREETLRIGYTTYEFLRRRKDGGPIYVNVSSKVVRKPGTGAPLILCTNKDVTHLRVQRDTALMEARYRDLPESAPTASRSSIRKPKSCSAVLGARSSGRRSKCSCPRLIAASVRRIGTVFSPTRACARCAWVSKRTSETAAHRADQRQPFARPDQ